MKFKYYTSIVMLSLVAFTITGCGQVLSDNTVNRTVNQEFHGTTLSQLVGQRMAIGSSQNSNSSGNEATPQGQLQIQDTALPGHPSVSYPDTYTYEDTVYSTPYTSSLFTHYLFGDVTPVTYVTDTSTGKFFKLYYSSC